MKNTQCFKNEIYFFVNDYKDKFKETMPLNYKFGMFQEYESHIQEEFNKACNKFGKFYLAKPKTLILEIIAFQEEILRNTSVSSVFDYIANSLQGLAFEDTNQIISFTTTRQLLSEEEKPYLCIYLKELNSEEEFINQEEEIKNARLCS